MSENVHGNQAGETPECFQTLTFREISCISYLSDSLRTHKACEAGILIFHAVSFPALPEQKRAKSPPSVERLFALFCSAPFCFGFFRSAML